MAADLDNLFRPAIVLGRDLLWAHKAAACIIEQAEPDAIRLDLWNLLRHVFVKHPPQHIAGMCVLHHFHYGAH